jgi:sec-independent protein translocase protein TatA
MGASGISFGELLIVLVIVLLIFGSGRLAKAGSDLGTAIRGFRKAMSGDAPQPEHTGASSRLPAPTGDGAREAASSGPITSNHASRPDSAPRR